MQQVLHNSEVGISHLAAALQRVEGACQVLDILSAMIIVLLAARLTLSQLSSATAAHMIHCQRPFV